jgi:hypothetical protein
MATIKFEVIEYNAKLHQSTNQNSRNESMDELAAQLRAKGKDVPVVVPIPKGNTAVQVTNAIRNGLGNATRKLKVKIASAGKDKQFLKVTLEEDLAAKAKDGQA